MDVDAPRLGAPLEGFRREILCGRYRNLVHLLARHFSAVGALPSYRYDYMLFSHILEGIFGWCSALNDMISKYELALYYNISFSH